MADENRPGWVVNPFPVDDPLVYEELSPQQVALRALLAVLADTGAEVLLPAELLGMDGVSVNLHVACGWRIEARMRVEEPVHDFFEPTRRTVRIGASWREVPFTTPGPEPL
jgi:hypothetical protein